MQIIWCPNKNDRYSIRQLNMHCAPTEDVALHVDCRHNSNLRPVWQLEVSITMTSMPQTHFDSIDWSYTEGVLSRFEDPNHAPYQRKKRLARCNGPEIKVLDKLNVWKCRVSTFAWVHALLPAPPTQNVHVCVRHTTLLSWSTTTQRKNIFRSNQAHAFFSVPHIDVCKIRSMLVNGRGLQAGGCMYASAASCAHALCMTHTSKSGWKATDLGHWGHSAASSCQQADWVYEWYWGGCRY